MLRIIKLITVLVMLASLAILPTFQPTRVAAQGTSPTSFADEFDSQTLDPAWQVVEFTGTRYNNMLSPANHVSLTDAPGHLRYSVDPMTYQDGFLNGDGFVSLPPNPWGYVYDPGLELRRTFSGDDWTLEAKVQHHLPLANHRFFHFRVYFGDGGAGTVLVDFYQYRDVVDASPKPVFIELTRMNTYGRASEGQLLESVFLGPFPDDIYYYKLQRAGGVLTALGSADGDTWTTKFSRDMGTDLNGLTQRVVIVGASWFITAGSYADYDYVRLTSSDQLAPTISCGAADDQWHADDVSITCTASDSESGLANTADASFSLSTSVPAGSETADAATDSRQVCDVAGNCATAGPISGNKVDKKAPDITLTTPAAATYLLNQAIGANYACADGGSGVVACIGTAANGSNIDTASAGAKTFVVNASDNVGNASSQSVQYTVNYAFSGFLAPVDNPSIVNTGRAGRTYPVKWQLTDAAGAFVSALRAVTSVTYKATSCGVFTGDSTAALETTATGATALRYDSSANQYVYNWATPSMGCYTLFLTLDSGQVFYAYFNLSK